MSFIVRTDAEVDLQRAYEKLSESKRRAFLRHNLRDLGGDKKENKKQEIIEFVVRRLNLVSELRLVNELLDRGYDVRIHHWGLIYEEDGTIRVIKEAERQPANCRAEVTICTSIMRREGIKGKLFDYRK